jgi:hypothetical protein
MIIDKEILEEISNYAYTDIEASRITRVILDKDENKKYIALTESLSKIIEEGIDDDAKIKAIIKAAAKYGEKVNEYMNDILAISEIIKENEIENEAGQAVEYKTVRMKDNHYEVADIDGAYTYPDSGIFELILAHAMKPGHSGRTDYMSVNGGWGYVFGRTESGEVFLFKTYAKIQYVLDFFSNPDIPEEIKNAILEEGIEI